MRIGVVTPWDVRDPRAWSGMVAPMVAALDSRATVVPLATDSVPDSLLDRALARVLDGRCGQRYLVGHALATGLKRGRALERRLRESSVDVVVAIAASQDIAFLRTDVPIVQVSDTTFRAIRNYYPLFSQLNPLSAAQADLQARLSARRTSHVLAATPWARDALIADGFSAERVLVAPFGPAITPDDSPRGVSADGPLRLLMVSSDWTRKGGPVVLAVWRLLRDRGVNASLTVVGDAPADLPTEVRALGRASHDEMRTIYSTHDVLLELAGSNAAGVTLTDAAGFGLPVVASRTGGVSGIVDDGVTGFLVEPGSADEAAARVTDLLDTQVRTVMGTAARRRAERLLNWSAWADEAMKAVHAAARRPQPSVVVLSPAVPYPGIEHAGGQYLRRLHDALAGSAAVTWLVQDRPSVRHAFRQPGVVPGVVLLGDHLAHSPVRRRLYRWCDTAETLLRRIDPDPPPLAAFVDLLTNPAARRAVRSASVLDFQWAAWTKLAPVARLINPQARVMFTFHDVVSQKCSRSAAVASGPLRRLRWRLAGLIATWWERHAVRSVDRVLVFSEKDRLLLDPHTTRPAVEVVNPPLSSGTELPHIARGTGHVLFVGFLARQENVDALLWFVDRVWPQVAHAVPHARLRVAGAALPGPVDVELRRRNAQIDLLGFVPDLEEEYANADVAVIPLRHGAGVKFKTIDALLRGVPTVTTSIGAEGIGGAELFAGLSDDEGGFAAAVISALRDSDGAARRARSSQTWAMRRYGIAAFEERLRALYLA